MNDNFEVHIRELIRRINLYLFIIILSAIILIGFTLVNLSKNSHFTMELFYEGLTGFVLFILYYIISSTKSRYIYLLDNYQSKTNEVLAILRSYMGNVGLFKRREKLLRQAYDALKNNLN